MRKASTLLLWWTYSNAVGMARPWAWGCTIIFSCWFWNINFCWRYFNVVCINCILNDITLELICNMIVLFKNTKLKNFQRSGVTPLSGVHHLVEPACLHFLAIPLFTWVQLQSLSFLTQALKELKHYLKWDGYMVVERGMLGRCQGRTFSVCYIFSIPHKTARHCTNNKLWKGWILKGCLIWNEG